MKKRIRILLSAVLVLAILGSLTACCIPENTDNGTEEKEELVTVYLLSQKTTNSGSSSLHKYEYDSNGNMKLDGTYGEITGYGSYELEYDYEYEYDDDGNVISRIGYSKGVKQSLNQYDSKGYITSSVAYTGLGKEYSHTDYEYEYFVTGNVKSIVTYMNGIKVFYTEYDSSGNMKSYIMYEEGEEYVRYECEYDSRGNIKSMVTYTHIAESVRSEYVYEYEYDSDNNIKSRTISFNGEKYSYSEYDSNGCVIYVSSSLLNTESFYQYIKLTVSREQAEKLLRMYNADLTLLSDVAQVVIKD